MAPAQYAPLPNPRSLPDADREMDDAFEADEDYAEDNETTPFNVQHTSAEATSSPTKGDSSQPHAQAGIYDFERDYDLPPPGSPPAPSSFAMPNNSIGNSNGRLPASPVVPPPPRQSFLRRAVGVLLPSHYQQVPTQPPRPQLRGGGCENDGVFANVMAKPGRQLHITTDDGEEYMVPEETQSEAPPSYAAAQLDAAPAYWETTVHAPAQGENSGDMIVDELPTGTVFTFLFTALVSWFFQLPGFLITYLCHATHAGRYGSQLGLAFTLIQFGFGASMSGAIDIPGMPVDGIPGQDGDGMGGGMMDGNGSMPMASATPIAAPSVTRPLLDWPIATSLPDSNSSAINNPYAYPELNPAVGHEWISFLLMTIGWFLLLTSIIGYVRVKRFEMSIRTSSSNQTLTPEDAQRDALLRRNLAEIFAMPLSPEEARPPPLGPVNENVERRELEEHEAGRLMLEARLQHDLRAAGLL